MPGYFGFNNLLELAAGTVTVSSEASGFEAAKAYNWFTNDFWKPSSVTAYLNLDAGSNVTADYFALGAHDLFTNSASIGLEYADDSGYTTNLTDAFSVVTPTDNSPIFRTFTSVSKRYWRVKITGAVASLGVVTFGDRLEIPVGIPPPFKLITEGREGKAIVSKSEGGQFIGKSKINEGVKGSLKLDFLTAAWVRANWPSFSEHLDAKSFFLQWDNTNYPDETALIWLPGLVPTPVYNRTNTLTATLKFEGQVR